MCPLFCTLLGQPAPTEAVREPLSISPGMPMEGCRKGFVIQLEWECTQSQHHLCACFLLCLPHTHKYSNRKIELLISCLPIIASPSVLLVLAISKALTIELTLLGEIFFLIIEFLHQDIFYIPRGWHRNQSLEFLTERRYFPHLFPSASIFLSTPFQSHLCQVSQETPALVTLQPNLGDSIP